MGVGFSKLLRFKHSDTLYETPHCAHCLIGFGQFLPFILIPFFFVDCFINSTSLNILISKNLLF